MAEATASKPDTDSFLLKQLNRLRELEDRDSLTVLPAEIKELSSARKFTLIKRIEKEIKYHKACKASNQSLNLPYKNQIFLNETEFVLWTQNKTKRDLNLPISYSVPSEAVAAADRPFYFPSKSDSAIQVFVTSCDTTLISSPALVTGCTSYRGTHTFQSLSSISSPSPIVPLDGTKAEKTSTPQEHKTVPPPPPFKKSDNSDSDKETPRKGAGEQLSTPFEKYRERPASVSSKDPTSRPGTPDSNISDDTEMEELQAQVARLRAEKEELAKSLQAATHVPSRSVQTERGEIGDLKSQVNDLVNMVKLLSVGQDLNATTDTERSAILRVNAANTDPPAQLLFARLEMPTNIIAKTTPRDPEALPILKPSVINSTIGTYDPAVDVDMDFRCIWDRIMDHTKNHQLYEHEYITCLRMVMKGQAAQALDQMNKEYKGDLKNILEAIQDLFIPQTSIYDELDELNHFKRRPEERISTMIRRASLIIYKLKETVAPAAWPDRRYNLLTQIIKQVIDAATFRHVRTEELKCAHTGTSLSLKAMAQIIDDYETSHSLVPKTEIKLTYNVNTMRLTNQPKVNQSEMDALRGEIRNLQASIKVLAPKRPRFSEPRVEKPPDVYMKDELRRKVLTPKRRLDGSAQTQPPYNKPSAPVLSGAQYSYTNSKPQGTKPFIKPQRFTPGYKKPEPAQYRSNNGQTQARGYIPPRVFTNDYRSYNRGNRSKSPYRNRGYTSNYGRYNNGNTPRSYSFRGKKHDVALHFYKCGLCEAPHQQGKTCPNANESRNPNF